MHGPATLARLAMVAENVTWLAKSALRRARRAAGRPGYDESHKPCTAYSATIDT